MSNVGTLFKPPQTAEQYARQQAQFAEQHQQQHQIGQNARAFSQNARERNNFNHVNANTVRFFTKPIAFHINASAAELATMDPMVFRFGPEEIARLGYIETSKNRDSLDAKRSGDNNRLVFLGARIEEPDNEHNRLVGMSITGVQNDHTIGSKSDKGAAFVFLANKESNKTIHINGDRMRNLISGEIFQLYADSPPELFEQEIKIIDDNRSLIKMFNPSTDTGLTVAAELLGRGIHEEDSAYDLFRQVPQDYFMKLFDEGDPNTWIEVPTLVAQHIMDDHASTLAEIENRTISAKDFGISIFPMDGHSWTSGDHIDSLASDSYERAEVLHGKKKVQAQIYLDFAVLPGKKDIKGKMGTRF